MKRILSLILLLITILLMGQRAQARTYSFCVYDNPPFNFKTTNGIHGLDMDIINGIIDPTKDKKLIINTERTLCLKLLKENIVDVVVGDFLFTRENANKYTLSTVLYSDPPVLFYRAYDKSVAINDVYQLSNKSVSIDRASDFQNVLTRMKDQYNIFITQEKTVNIALHKILDKKANYLFGSLDIIGLEKDIPELSALTNVLLTSTKKYMDSPERQLKFYYPRGWLFSSNRNKRLKVRSLDLKLRKVYINGTLDSLLQKYNLEFLYPQKYIPGEDYQEPPINFLTH